MRWVKVWDLGADRSFDLGARHLLSFDVYLLLKVEEEIVSHLSPQPSQPTAVRNEDEGVPAAVQGHCQ
jgi:hypothetical protein